MPEITLDQHRSQLNFVNLPGGRIAYLDLGPRSGHPVLLVHGMPTSSFLYRKVARDLAAAGVRAIAPDLLGFGASDKPRDRDLYDYGRQGTRLTALLDHLNLPTATFVAHDLGGPWTWEVADRSPQRLSGLVVLNTSAYPDLMKPPLEARLVGGPLGPLMLKMMGSRAGRPMIHDFFTKFTSTQTPIDKASSLAYWTSLNEGGTAAFRAFSVGLKRIGTEWSRYPAAVRDLNVPATVIWGTEDPVLRHERLVTQFATDLRVPEQDIHRLSGASHFLQEDRPAEVAELIAQFVTIRVGSPTGH